MKEEKFYYRGWEGTFRSEDGKNYSGEWHVSGTVYPLHEGTFDEITFEFQNNVDKWIDYCVCNGRSDEIDMTTLTKKDAKPTDDCLVLCEFVKPKGWTVGEVMALCEYAGCDVVDFEGKKIDDTSELRDETVLDIYAENSRIKIHISVGMKEFVEKKEAQIELLNMFAAKFNGREYRKELSDTEKQELRANDIICVYGASDDLLEFEGAFSEEYDIYGGGRFLLRDGCLRTEEDGVSDDWNISAQWDKDGYSWVMDVRFPHKAYFDIMEDGEKYCRAVLFLKEEVWNG